MVDVLDQMTLFVALNGDLRLEWPTLLRGHRCTTGPLRGVLDCPKPGRTRERTGIGHKETPRQKNRLSTNLLPCRGFCMRTFYLSVLSDGLNLSGPLHPLAAPQPTRR